MTMSFDNIKKRINMSKHKKLLPHSSLITEGQMHLCPSFYFQVMLQFVETISKMKLNTLVTQYKHIIIFNFAHLIFLSGA